MQISEKKLILNIANFTCIGCLMVYRAYIVHYYNI